LTAKSSFSKTNKVKQPIVSKFQTVEISIAFLENPYFQKVKDSNELGLS